MKVSPVVLGPARVKVRAARLAGLAGERENPGVEMPPAPRSRQVGQLPAGRPRIPPYSVLHRSQWNMVSGYPIGGRVEPL
jgi:hypothetical protein